LNTKVSKLQISLDYEENDLKRVFHEVRDYFAGNVTGITRDEQIAQNLMRLLFCKLIDERENKTSRVFSSKSNVKELELSIDEQFSKIISKYPSFFEKGERIEIRGLDLKYMVERLAEFELLTAERDVIADAFEEIIGTAFRGGEGQFFTPRNVVQMMIDVLDPKAHELVIDPACGSGGFISACVKHIASKGEFKNLVYGIDKDGFLAKIARIYVSILANQPADVFCENSLAPFSSWNSDTKKSIRPESFDVVLTNPPFGAKIPVIGEDLLAQYQLASNWNPLTNKFDSSQILDKQAPQVLFIERCMQLLKVGGRMGIVLPEGIFGNSSDKYIWNYVEENAKVFGIIGLAQETFQPSTHTKTSVLFLEKGKPKKSNSIFMGVADSVGHNKNGKITHKLDKNGSEVIDDDMPEITRHFQEFRQGKKFEANRLSFILDSKNIVDHVYIPDYYDPEIDKEITKLKKSGQYNVVTIGDLIDQGILEIRRGNEIGSENYGTGSIPFVRTSDIVNWEIKADPVKAVSREVYDSYAKNQDVKTNDILFVSDGTFLIGRSAMVGPEDTEIVIQSHVKKIRVIKQDIIDPYYLFYLLNSSLFKRQVKAKTFVQATISTIGNRLYEIELPISLEKEEVAKVSKKVKSIMDSKAKIRKEIVALIEVN
jgi:type I restriction enzyme M protein